MYLTKTRPTSPVIGGFTFILVLLAAGSFQTANAGMFSWGDIFDPAGDVMFLDVTEDNAIATSLYAPEPGTGSPTALLNSIMLDPQGFQSQSSGGGSDSLASTITTTIMANPGQVINNINLQEIGDYSLGGTTGGVAAASVDAEFSWTILEIDNLPNVQPTQMQNLLVTTGSGPNGGAYARPGDDGTAVVWEGTVFIDLDAYLQSQNIAGSVTKVELSLVNTLDTSSDASSNAFIKKKEIGGAVMLSVNIPEPASVALAALALGGLLVGRRFSRD